MRNADDTRMILVPHGVQKHICRVLNVSDTYVRRSLRKGGATPLVKRIRCLALLEGGAYAGDGAVK